MSRADGEGPTRFGRSVGFTPRGGRRHQVAVRVEDRLHELARLLTDFGGSAPQGALAHKGVRPAPFRSADPCGGGFAAPPRDTRATGLRGGYPREVRLLPKSRDFH